MRRRCERHSMRTSNHHLSRRITATTARWTRSAEINRIVSSAIAIITPLTGCGCWDARCAVRQSAPTSHLRRADAYAAAMDIQATFREEAHCFWVRDLLFFEHAMREGVGGVIIEHRAGALKDDRS